MIAEPSPQHRPTAQRWGRRGVRDATAVSPQRLKTATSSTSATTIADATTADSPISGGVATCAPMAASPTLTRQPGSPLSSPSSAPSGSRVIESARTAGDYDTSPHVVVPARQCNPTAFQETAFQETAFQETAFQKTASQAVRVPAPAVPAPSTLPAPPAPPGMFSQWEPVASATPAEEVNPADAAAIERRSRITKLATVLIAVCVVAIFAVIIFSSIRLTGLAELELSNQQLSERFRTEALVWVPTVALLSALLAGAAIVRSKFAS